MTTTTTTTAWRLSGQLVPIRAAEWSQSSGGIKLRAAARVIAPITPFQAQRRLKLELRMREPKRTGSLGTIPDGSNASRGLAEIEPSSVGCFCVGSRETERQSAVPTQLGRMNHTQCAFVCAFVAGAGPAALCVRLCVEPLYMRRNGPPATPLSGTTSAAAPIRVGPPPPPGTIGQLRARGRSIKLTTTNGAWATLAQTLAPISGIRLAAPQQIERARQCGAPSNEMNCTNWAPPSIGVIYNAPPLGAPIRRRRRGRGSAGWPGWLHLGHRIEACCFLRAGARQRKSVAELVGREAPGGATTWLPCALASAGGSSAHPQHLAGKPRRPDGRARPRVHRDCVRRRRRRVHPPPPPPAYDSTGRQVRVASSARPQRVSPRANGGQPIRPRAGCFESSAQVVAAQLTRQLGERRAPRPR